jgi:hypothetical protein
MRKLISTLFLVAILAAFGFVLGAGRSTPTGPAAPTVQADDGFGWDSVPVPTV